MSLFPSVIVTNVQEGSRAVLTVLVTWLADTYVGDCKTQLFFSIAYAIGLTVWYIIYPDPGYSKIFFSLGLFLIIIGQSNGNNRIKGEIGCVKFELEVASNNEEEDKDEDQDGNNLQDNVKGQLMCGETNERFSHSRRLIIAFWRVWCANWISIVGFCIAVFVVSMLPDRTELLALMCMLFISSTLFLVGHWRCIYPFNKPICRVAPVDMREDIHRRSTYIEHHQHIGESHEDNISGHGENALTKFRSVNKATLLGPAKQDIVVDSMQGLCTVKVKKTTNFTRIMSFSMVFLMYGAISAVGETFFSEQGDNMKPETIRKIEVPTQLPVLSAEAIRKMVKRLCHWIMEKKVEASNRMFYTLWQMGLGILLSVPCFMIAYLVEAKRLTNNINVLWLTPQFVLLGVMDGLAVDGLEYFLKKEMPTVLTRSYSGIIAEGIVGMGKLLNVVWLTILYYITKSRSEPAGWFGKDINGSHLDCYYRSMACFGLLNVFIYVWAANAYYHRQLQEIPDGGVEETDGNVESGT